MMKKILVLALAAFATTAAAGEYHVYTKLICSDCHTMHASRTHSFGSETLNTQDTKVFGAGTTGGHESLLLGADVNQTCLTCHDNVPGIPDVFGANGGSREMLARSAGALNSAAGYLTNDSGYAPRMGHSLGSTLVPPGFSKTTAAPNVATGLECNNCHSVHGSYSYRNLSGDKRPSYTMSSTATTLDFQFDVNVLAGSGYSANDVFYTDAHLAPAATGPNKMNLLCGTCHGAFHDAAIGGLTTTGTVDWFKRHPTDQATYTTGGVFTGEGSLAAPARSNLSLKVVAVAAPAATDWARGSDNGAIAPGAGFIFSPGCLTCHKAHGNKNDFGLFYPGNYVTAVNAPVHVPDTNMEEGNGTSIRNLCNSCHGPGRTNANYYTNNGGTVYK